MLELIDVSKTYKSNNGQSIFAVENLGLEIYPNEFLCIVGRSGCGKTTTLRMIAGLELSSKGRIVLNGKKIRKPSPKRCVVFQKYTLFPWRTVVGNIAFGLETQKVNKKRRLEIAEKYIQLVGLEKYALAYPYELSGGMQQRVAFARALAVDPQILLMDEPFGALDAQTRNTLQDELIKIWQKHQKTIIFVTHSINEAVYIADRIVIMKSNPGRIQTILKNDLQRPRNKSSWEFRKYYKYVHELLEET